MRIELGIEPMGAVRTTRAMAGRTRAGQRYAAYKEFIAWEVKKKIKSPLTQAVGIESITFHMPIPKSLEGKVKVGQWHTKKPDIDNLVKGLFDAANGVAWVDDNRIVSIGQIKKVYSDKPGIVFSVEEIGGLAHGQEAHPKRQTKSKQKGTSKKTGGTSRRIQRRL